jgi:hypothetical protein
VETRRFRSSRCGLAGFGRRAVRLAGFVVVRCGWPVSVVARCELAASVVVQCGWPRWPISRSRPGADRPP